MLLDMVIGTSTYVKNTDYDAAGRVDVRDLGILGSNPVIRVNYTYFSWTALNGQGRLNQMTSGIITDLDSLQDLRYTYDANGDILTIQDYKACTTHKDRSGVRYPQTQTFTYDSLDRLTSAVASGGSGGTYGLQNYTYNASTGNLASKAGVSLTYGDTNHDHAVTAMGSNSYGYDANGNQTSRNISGSAYTLAYDAENRLVGVTGGATQTFIYNGDGKRVKSTGSYMNLAAGIVPTGDVTINNAQVITDNDPWADDSSQYATATSGLHYVKIDLGAVYSVNKVNIWHYANDGRTYHSTKTQVSADGTNWVTVYDSAVSGEYQETAQGKEITFAAQNVRYVRDYVNGNTVNVYGHWVEIEVWGYGTVTYVGNSFEWTGSTATMQKYYYAGSNRVAVRRGSDSLYWLLGDHLGSQAITTDANGSKISEVRYYPWGGDRYYAYTSSTTFRFTGQRTEFGLGLYYYGARWYDPSIMRFVQPDTDVPVSQGVQAWDRYAYTNNNPVKYIDPSGHMLTLPCIFCNQTWGNYSTTSSVENKAIDIVSTIGCFFVGCHVDTKNDVISGPTTNEFVTSSVMSIGPAPLTVTTPLETTVLSKFGGETVDTIAGRAAHNNYPLALGPDYTYNRQVPGTGIRPDALDTINRVVRELKPDTPAAIQRGLKQLQRYVDVLQQVTGEIWTGFLDLYRK